jgi:molybdopterin/thiamine biosynthesis adenylyltransferase
MGVFAPLVGIIGSMQAAEALKLLAQVGGAVSLAGRLQMLDARRMEWSEILVQRDPVCAVCAARPHCQPDEIRSHATKADESSPQPHLS